MPSPSRSRHPTAALDQWVQLEANTQHPSPAEWGLLLNAPYTSTHPPISPLDPSPFLRSASQESVCLTRTLGVHSPSVGQSLRLDPFSFFDLTHFQHLLSLCGLIHLQSTKNSLWLRQAVPRGFKSNLDYMRLCLRKRGPSSVPHVCKPSTQEAKAGGLYN